MTEPLIQIGILTSDSIKFNLKGNFSTPNKTVFSGNQQALVQEGKVMLEGLSFNKLTLVPLETDCSFELMDVVIGIGFHWERKENQCFKGSLKLIVENNKLIAINEITVENYLTSVISSEMSASASEELLKAHAVISRSWVLKNPMNSPQRNRRGKLPEVTKKESDNNTVFQENTDELIIKWYERNAHTLYDVCADDHCQRYQGITRETNSTVQKAIDATRGEVLMYDGHICDARFSKSCGGATEVFENCWANEQYPYLTSIIDNKENNSGLDLSIEENAQNWIRQLPESFCKTSDNEVLKQVLNNYDQETTDYYRWKLRYTQHEITELICRKSGIEFGQIIDLVPLKRGKSGRIINLKIIGTKKTIVVGKELEIRKWLSNTHLYSSAFVVDKFEITNLIPQYFTLIGAGWGHGVGLCQIGAAVMGEKGYTYKEILSHYYKETNLKTLYK